MAEFVKGEIVCSLYDNRYIGVVERLEYNNLGEVRRDGHIVSCYIDPDNNLRFIEGFFKSFQKATRKQKEHFKKVLLKHGYSYYKGKVIKEL